MAIHYLFSSRFQSFLLSSFCLCLLTHHGNSLSFTLDFSNTNLKSADAFNISTEGDAFINEGRLSLTKDTLVSNIDGSVGRATYKHPVPFRDNKTGEVTNFSTRFSFQIQNTTPDNFGDGFAFFLSPYPSQLPPSSGGGDLGLFNSSVELNSSANRLVAVEFDTYYNQKWDPPNTSDWSLSHVGIDVNNINSTVYTIIPNELFVGKKMSAWINYNNETTLLSLYLSHDDNTTINYSLNTTVDLKNSMSDEIAVGFSAATGKSIELHQIYSWSFNSSLELASINTIIPKKKRSFGVLIVLIIACVVIVLILVGMLVYHLRKRASSKTQNEIEMSIENEFGRESKKFSYSELAAATMDFAKDTKLGEGGFGSVYRGVLRDEGSEVAIKRVSKGSKQGKKEYISEVKIISRLRHRNLVQLVGWCHEQGDFLVVYELMPNGSLDTHLYNQERFLTWPVRHKIALDLASALVYLHSECNQCVVHRDIKPSNIMLDSFFNAKLGDFGLARLIDHGAESQHTLPAGTMGYMAPECVINGMTSSESDVYSFGIVLLEITCGRNPIVLNKDQNAVRLVEWVWGLYGSNSILDAVDKRLNGELEAPEAECLMVVGLWCAHPVHTLRPSIRQAMSALNFESPLPLVPLKMPVPTYSALIYDNNSSDTSSLGNTSTGMLSSNNVYVARSSNNTGGSSSTSDSSWLLKQSGAR